MNWMRYYAWLKDCREICRIHPIQIRLGRKNSQEIENVQQKLTIQWW